MQEWESQPAAATSRLGRIRLVTAVCDVHHSLPGITWFIVALLSRHIRFVGGASQAIRSDYGAHGRSYQLVSQQ